MQKPILASFLAGVTALLAACSTNSPTSPSPSPTPTAQGISLVASANQAETSTAILLSARVTSGGQNVADNTSVMFRIDTADCIPGVETTPHFENGECEVTRTTLNGVATATVVSLNAGQWSFVARVPNVSASVLLRWFAPTNPRNLAIYSVQPNRGRPEGGEQVLIRGRGFATPVTVDFIIAGFLRHAQVLSVSAAGDQITVVTPAGNPQANTEQSADIRVTAGAGTADQVQDTLSGGFVYERAYATPRIYAVEPSRGSYAGGEQVKILGAGFAAPLRVTFGAEDAQIVSTSTDNAQITVLTPRHSGHITSELRVNVNVTTRFETAQQQTVSLDAGYTYVPDSGLPMLYSVTPSQGSPRGGETVVLTGKNFTPPVNVEFILATGNTLPATVLEVSSDATRMTVVTPQASPTAVTTDVTADIRITNQVGAANSQSAVFSRVFTYIGESRPPQLFYLDPNRGSCKGRDSVRVYGRYFLPPAKVEFAIGGMAEVTGVAADGTYIDILTPPHCATFPLDRDIQTDVTVTTQYGTGRDQTVTLINGWQWLAEVHTPELFALSPNSGPIEGGTRVTITGQGFESPVEVLFGDHQAQVVAANFDEVICISPSITATQPTTPTTVQVSVKNVLTGKQSPNTLPFRYGEAMFISAISPTEGPIGGGTTVTIYGQGFSAPVDVTVAGYAVAQVLSVSGTEVVVNTAAVPDAALGSCADKSGPVVVTNINSSLRATGPTFTYRVQRPLIYGVEVTKGGVSYGNSVPEYDPVNNCLTNWDAYTVHVRGDNFEKIGSTGTSAMRVRIDPVGINVPATTWISRQEVTFILPNLSGVPIDTVACSLGGVEGTQKIPTPLSLTVTNTINRCEDTIDSAMFIAPCNQGCSVKPTINLTPKTLQLSVGSTGTVTVSISSPQLSATVVSLEVVDTGVFPPATLVVQPTVTIPANQTSVTFDVTAGASGGPVRIIATLPAGLGGASASTVVTVVGGDTPFPTLIPHFLDLAVGSTGQMSVVLSAAQPTATLLSLSYSGALGVITGPDSVLVPANSAQASFTITAVGIGGPVTITATLPASLGSGYDTAIVNVVSPPTLAITPGALTIPRGSVGNFRIDIGRAQPNAVVATLTYGGQAGIVSGPSSVTIPALFTFTTFNVSGLAVGGPIQITATLPPYLGAATATATITVSEIPAVTIAITPPSRSVTVGGDAPFTITMSGTQATDTIITLVSAIPGVATVPATVTIGAGLTSATFNAHGVAAGGPVTITATLPGYLGSGQTTAQVTVTNITQTLTVVRAGLGGGTVTSSPPGINCGTTCAASFTYSSTVSLTAIPDVGSSFSKWNCGAGDLLGNATISVVMNSNQLCTVTFNTP